MSKGTFSPAGCALVAIIVIHACFLVAALRALLLEGLKQAAIIEGIGFSASLLLFGILVGVHLLNDRRQDNLTIS
jgi:hypothetical protein